MIANHGNSLIVFILFVIVSCASVPGPKSSPNFGLGPSQVHVLENRPQEPIEQLSVAEYGPVAPFLGTWEIEGHIFLSLEPEGSFLLSNFYMSGDPDPRHWYERGYCYLRAGVLYLERTSTMNTEAIPSEINQSTLAITLYEDNQSSAVYPPSLVGRSMNKIEVPGPFQIENYRSARSNSLTNPVNMLLPEQTVAEALKRNAELWGEWLIKDKIILILSSNGKFIAFDPSPQSLRLGWGASGQWHLEQDSLILEIKKSSLEEHIPSYFLGKEVRLAVLCDPQHGEIKLTIGTQTLAKRLN